MNGFIEWISRNTVKGTVTSLISLPEFVAWPFILIGAANPPIILGLIGFLFLTLTFLSGILICFGRAPKNLVKTISWVWVFEGGLMFFAVPLVSMATIGAFRIHGSDGLLFGQIGALLVIFSLKNLVWFIFLLNHSDANA